MSEEYSVPQELQDIIIECTAMRDLRDGYIKRPFGFKRAKQCAIKHTQLNNKFWREIYLLYPELKGKSMDYRDGYVAIIIEGISKD